MMNWEKLDKQTVLLDSEAKDRYNRNREYLMELEVDNLLLPYRLEAGMLGSINYRLEGTHGGWDNPLSQIRGTFTGHWLSAAASIYAETEDLEIKQKADFIVSEIKKCQEANGGRWLFPIPEKYLLGLKEGKHFWAPHYVCHKVMIGLFHMYKLAGNQDSLEMISKVADWFLDFTKDVSRAWMDEMMNLEETGGIMELWADLYGDTGDDRYRELMVRYQRSELMDSLLEGEDKLTNMHANTTIPEVHGLARAYEVTGEVAYKKAVETFWEQAVTNRGQFATGGQTCGEIWTPKGRQQARLGETNQEHCVVYNMIRLADYLFRWSGEVKYADYIEQNIWNGLFAQGYWQGRNQDSLAEPIEPETGLVAYYLPLASGSKKKWGSKTEHFWCCHCTLVQANAEYKEWFVYQQKNHMRIAQYFPFQTNLEIDGNPLTIKLEKTDFSGSTIDLAKAEIVGQVRPSSDNFTLFITAGKPVVVTFSFRIPWWVQGDVGVRVHGAEVSTEISQGYLQVTGTFSEAEISLCLPKKISVWPLVDAPNYIAFLEGPVLLAGLTEEERTIYVREGEKPEQLLVPREERKWSTWGNLHQITGQPINFTFKPLYDIGKEVYTVYFPLETR